MQQADSLGKTSHLCAVPVHNGTALMMEWAAVRGELQRLRVERQPNKSAFARTLGISRSTIDRIEDVESDPDYAVDLETIARWAAAVGLTLSDLFLRIEHAHDRDRSGHSNNVNAHLKGQRKPVTTPPPPTDEADHALSVSESLDAADRLARAKQDLARALIDAGSRLAGITPATADQSSEDVDRDKSSRRSARA